MDDSMNENDNFMQNNIIRLESAQSKHTKHDNNNKNKEDDDDDDDDDDEKTKNKINDKTKSNNKISSSSSIADKNKFNLNLPSLYKSQSSHFTPAPSPSPTSSSSKPNNNSNNNYTSSPTKSTTRKQLYYIPIPKRSTFKTSSVRLPAKSLSKSDNNNNESRPPSIFEINLTDNLDSFAFQTNFQQQTNLQQQQQQQHHHHHQNQNDNYLNLSNSILTPSTQSLEHKNDPFIVTNKSQTKLSRHGKTSASFAGVRNRVYLKKPRNCIILGNFLKLIIRKK
jgi:hypothetical protein